MPSEFEARMVEYVKLLNKELRNSTNTSPSSRQGSTSPPTAASPREALNALEMSRLTLWNLYNSAAAAAAAAAAGTGGEEAAASAAVAAASLGAGGRHPASSAAAGGGPMPPPPPQKEALNLEVSRQQQQQAAMAAAAAAAEQAARGVVESSPSSGLMVKKEEELCDLGPPPSKRMLIEEEGMRMHGGDNGRGHPGANIKIASRGDGRTGSDSSLVVSMEINGITYQGVLFAQTTVTGRGGRHS